MNALFIHCPALISIQILMRIAIYGKGGIGKSTVTSNLSYSLTRVRKRVLQIGCDPKADSTRPLLNGKVQMTVTEYMRKVPPSKRSLEDIVNIGSGGVMCIEAGGPRPGVGCAGKGIVGMFQTLEKIDVSSLNPDYVLYDVLGDVVCGGFAVPMRTDYSDAVLIVTSGEYMSLYAANNIMKGTLSFESGKGRVIGLILNRRGLSGEDELVEAFSDATGVPIICRVARSESFRRAESDGITVSERFPESEESRTFGRLAADLIDLKSDRCVSPTPLTDLQLDELYSKGRLNGKGSFVFEEDRITNITDVPVINRPRRIGKGPVSSVLEGAKVTDIPVVIHGTNSCGYTMLNEVSEERIRHLMADGFAFSSSGENLMCSSMTPDSAVFGGTEDLRSTLNSLVNGYDIILVIATCLPGMIGDDCDRVISDILTEHPGKRVLYVDANRVDSGFDAHIEVIRELSKIIDTDVEPLHDYVNIVDDSFVELNKGNDRKYVDSILSEMGLRSGPGFLNDCSVADIINLRRYGICILGDDGRDNRIIRSILEQKGIRFLDDPLPKGYQETMKWLESISKETNRDVGHVADRIRSEYSKCISRYSKDLSDVDICIVSWNLKEDLWIAEALSDCGCTVNFLTVGTDATDVFPSMSFSSISELKGALHEGKNDVIVDMMGIIDEPCVRLVSTKTHSASMDLIRSVWGMRMSNLSQRWKEWGE